MTLDCPRCGQKDVEIFTKCSNCGYMVTTDDICRPLEILLPQLKKCSRCDTAAFDGHRCHKCGASISGKAKTAHPCVLVSEKEEKLVTNYFLNH